MFIKNILLYIIISLPACFSSEKAIDNTGLGGSTSSSEASLVQVNHKDKPMDLAKALDSSLIEKLVEKVGRKVPKERNTFFLEGKNSRIRLTGNGIEAWIMSNSKTNYPEENRLASIALNPNTAPGGLIKMNSSFALILDEKKDPILLPLDKNGVWSNLVQFWDNSSKEDKQSFKDMLIFAVQYADEKFGKENWCAVSKTGVENGQTDNIFTFKFCDNIEQERSELSFFDEFLKDEIKFMDKDGKTIEQFAEEIITKVGNKFNKDKLSISDKLNLAIQITEEIAKDKNFKLYVTQKKRDKIFSEIDRLIKDRFGFETKSSIIFNEPELAKNSVSLENFKLHKEKKDFIYRQTHLYFSDGRTIVNVLYLLNYNFKIGLNSLTTGFWKICGY